MRTACGTIDSLHGRRRLDKFHILHQLPTIGDRFEDLELMGGISALGLLAIKNNMEAFMHLLDLSLNSKMLLQQTDLYGNTVLHYIALRGISKLGVIAQLEEIGADARIGNAVGELPIDVIKTQRITCKEPQQSFAAQFCVQRMITSVVKL